MEYNPSNGDTISGPCKLVNTIGGTNSDSGLPLAGLPDTGETNDESSLSGRHYSCSLVRTYIIEMASKDSHLRQRENVCF